MEPALFSYEIGYAEVTIRDRAALLGVLREIAKRYASRIVCFDAEKLAGRPHAEAALRHAHRAFAQGSAISNSFEMEALLYAAGTRQCSLAVPFGLHEGENHLYVCCCPAPEGIWKDLAVHMQFGGEPDEMHIPGESRPADGPVRYHTSRDRGDGSGSYPGSGTGTGRAAGCQ